jgi:hypothetical protein
LSLTQPRSCRRRARNFSWASCELSRRSPPRGKYA